MKDEQTEALKRFNDMQAKIVAEYVQTSVIKELKRLKAEIKQNQNLYYYNKKTDTYEAIFKTDTVLKVIDNHIEELKGEQE